MFGGRALRQGRATWGDGAARARGQLRLSPFMGVRPKDGRGVYTKAMATVRNSFTACGRAQMCTRGLEARPEWVGASWVSLRARPRKIYYFCFLIYFTCENNFPKVLKRF
jgi:hypothetical protein